MGSRFCNNETCRTTNSHEWKRGWPLPSPMRGFANLCHRCGCAYENSVFCETFHLEDTGWRECRSCGKQVHCGCASSLDMYKVLAFGGICCLKCANHVQHISSQNDEAPKGFGVLKINDACDCQSSPVQNRVVSNCADEGGLLQLCKVMEANESILLPRPQNVERNASFSRTKQDECLKQTGETGPSFPCATQSSVGSLTFPEQDNNISGDVKNMHDSLAQPSLNMTLVTPSRTHNLELPFSGAIVDGREQNKASSSFQQGQQSRPIFPKPSKSGLAMGLDTNKSPITQMRIARPPGEGRGKNQLLPRYWPRITDQELEKLSGDLKSSIVPLFEKVLSASDAGRIGRLVLPKACAEAYFPSINQSEGIPLRIQDVKGNEWTFQFRFWPNNNSRMYVLEGVTPCIQAMQLQAGDTVTFSRIDPGGKLVMGFRRASNSEDVQDAQTSALANGTSSGEASFSGIIENLPTGNSYSSPFLTKKRSKEPCLDSYMCTADGDSRLLKGGTNGCKANDDSLQKLVLISEKKRTRNLGSKSKRLLMHSEDVLELRLTWEEAQDLLRPPPSVKPSVVTIEDHEFEEYDEPPVFGKRTIFLSVPFGGQEQWAQCDDCSKWRRLPVEAALPPKWTCSENVWDSSRCSCSVREELSSKELENVLRGSKDLKKRKTVESQRNTQEHEPSGLDALASAAALGDKIDESGETSVGATTKHPRHRPGCTCIVCIQPPSGKGRHKPTCTCNVCMTVKRRFKTLMLRKKKRREAETIQKDGMQPKVESETNGTLTVLLPHVHRSDNVDGQSRAKADVAETSAAQIDLNSHPNREDMQEDSGWNMTSLVEAAGLPLDNYMKQNGMTNLMCGQQTSFGSCLFTEVTEENRRNPSDKASLASSTVQRREHMGAGVNGESTSDRNDHP